MKDRFRISRKVPFRRNFAFSLHGKVCYHQLTNFGGDLVVGRAHLWIASTTENHIFCHRVAVAEALVLPSPCQSVPLYSRIFAVSSALEGPK
jgi:hypothetical protein